MNVSRDSMLALQRHFLGALSAPSRTWLAPLPASQLAFAGSAVRKTREGCMLDFGIVDSPGEEHFRVRVCNPGGDDVLVRLAERPPWLRARFTDAYEDVVALGANAACATLELTIAHDTECELAGALHFVVSRGDAQRSEELPVRMIARRSHPLAQFDFNGRTEPHAFDFGASDDPYVLSVDNRSSVPLAVTFADLPAWLSFEVNGARRSGPVAGRFFERSAPFTVRIKPLLLGRHEGAIRIRTNDPRAELQSFELHFAACVVAPQPYLRAYAPHGVRLRADQTATTRARLENWGSLPAHTTRKSLPKALALQEAPIVPAAVDGNPGIAILPIRVLPAHLPAGQHRLSVTLEVDGGDPAEVDVPVHVEVLQPARRVGRIPAEMVAALVTLLLLTLLFVFIVRGLP